MRIDGVGIGTTPIPAATPGSGRTASFENIFRDSIRDVNRLQANVENLSLRTFAGEDVDPAVVATAINKADLAYRTLIQIRTKLIDAFNELRNLQI